MSQDQWYTSVEDEISALHMNGTWTLTDLPLDKRAVGCKWVYTLKFKGDGSIERYRARLVSKGYSQTPGVDYGEMFSPVAKLNSVKRSYFYCRNFQLGAASIRCDKCLPPR